jgi:hypothetical protein
VAEAANIRVREQPAEEAEAIERSVVSIGEKLKIDRDHELPQRRMLGEHR